MSAEERFIVLQRVAALKAKLATTPACKEPSRFSMLTPRVLLSRVCIGNIMNTTLHGFFYSPAAQDRESALTGWLRLHARTRNLGRVLLSKAIYSVEMLASKTHMLGPLHTTKDQMLGPL